MNLDAVENLNRSLRAFDGGEAIVWSTMRYQSAVVIAISAPGSPATRAFLDCIACQRVSYQPSWKPSTIRCRVQDRETSPLLVTDGINLQIDCKTARLTIEHSDANAERIFASTVRHLTPVGLIAKLCKENPESFASLAAYFDGYSFALEQHLLPWDDSKPSIYAFQEWIKSQLGWDRTSAGWKTPVISEFPEDKEAAEQFCKLFLEFERQWDQGCIDDPPPRRGNAT